jgi:hypothetical protein
MAGAWVVPRAPASTNRSNLSTKIKKIDGIFASSSKLLPVPEQKVPAEKIGGEDRAKLYSILVAAPDNFTQHFRQKSPSTV